MHRVHLGKLDFLYAWMLDLGFMILREAIHVRNDDWIQAELELLHNVPSLIGEPNIERHRYFWHKERTTYMDWISTQAPPRAASMMRTYYDVVWEEMAPLMPPSEEEA